MRPTVSPQSTPWRFRFTLSQTRTISAKRAEVHQNLSRRPSPHGTATKRRPVKCRHGHHGVQTRRAGAADHGIEDGLSGPQTRMSLVVRSVPSAITHRTTSGGPVATPDEQPLARAGGLDATHPKRTEPRPAARRGRAAFNCKTRAAALCEFRCRSMLRRNGFDELPYTLCVNQKLSARPN